MDKEYFYASQMEDLKPFLLHYGYWAVLGAIFLEDFGIPMPGETFLIAGAVLASQGDMHIVPLLIFAWSGAILGDNLGYVIGHFAGRRLVLRYGRYVFITRNRLDFAEKFFKRHGGIVVLFARFIEVLRQLNGIIAGIVQMRWQRFFLYNALGAALWVSVWVILFYQVGTQASNILQVFKHFEILVIVLLVLSLVGVAGYFVYSRWRSSKDK